MQARGDCKSVVQRPSHSLVIQVVRRVARQLSDVPTSVSSFLDSVVRILGVKEEWVVRKAVEQRGFLHHLEDRALDRSSS